MSRDYRGVQLSAAAAILQMRATAEAEKWKAGNKD